MVHNGITSVICCLSGQQIKHTKDPGVATTMLGLLTLPEDFSKSQGLNKVWLIDNPADIAAENTGFVARRDFIIVKPTPIKGNFRSPSI